MSTNIGYSIDSKYFQCITLKKHSYDLQNEIIKNWSEEFIFFAVSSCCFIGGCLHSCSGTGLCRQGRCSYFHDIGYDK